MKKRVLGLLLVTSTLVLAGCNNGGGESTSTEPTSTSEPAPAHVSKDVNAQMAPSLNSKRTSPYELTFHYDDEYFLTNAKTYDKNLSMLSFGTSLLTDSKQKCLDFFNATGFKDIKATGFDAAPTKDSVGYILAHKRIDDNELITVNVRGLEYGLEWYNNFMMGLEGDHEGFALRANEVYTDLQSYISSYRNNRNLKLWLTGYSRGGAITNVLSSLILRENKVSVKQEDMYVYTFEAPNCVSEEHAIPYENVHNIINDADMIPAIPPTSLHFGRCGVAYPIYDVNISTLIKEFDAGIEIPEFVDCTMKETTYHNDIEVLNFILNDAFNKPDIEPDKGANTREQYVNNYQEGIGYAIAMIFALSNDTRSAMLSDLKDLGVWGLLPIIGDETGGELAKFVKTYLDRDHVSYTDAELTSACATLLKAVVYIFFSNVVAIYMNEATSGDLMRLIDFHFQESVYVLLKNAHSK